VSDFVVIGNPEGRRLALFQAALAGLGLPPAQVVSYRDLIAGPATLDQVVREGTILRIESPGQDDATMRALVAAGSDVDLEDEDEDEPGLCRVGREQALRQPFDRGLIFYPRQWYLGFRQVLRRIEQQRTSCPRHTVMNPPDAIEVMFDKRRCHERLVSRGIPCPRALGPVRCYEELRSLTGQAGLGRVFVKLAHGSSASGVVALAIGPGRQLAITTVEMVHEPGRGLRLYNSRRIRRYEQAGEIVALIDALCREGVHVEQWVPKAGLEGMAFDLRVVVIDGRAEHIIPRLSRSPMTNLHLKNRRGDLGALRAKMDANSWEAALETCRQAVAAFPGCLYAGVDLLIAPGYRRHAVLEVNAFGDLLPGLTCRGRDTYTAEVAAVIDRSQEIVPWST
jgi:glutathione synthase/RimK-type ligase-like ATP-grasp enzyme